VDSIEFPLPQHGIRARKWNLATVNGTAMPEVAVDPDGKSATRKDQVGLTGLRELRVQTEARSSPVQRRSKQDLRPRVDPLSAAKVNSIRRADPCRHVPIVAGLYGESERRRIGGQPLTAVSVATSMSSQVGQVVVPAVVNESPYSGGLSCRGS
jgi:hypothetical protein